MTIREMLAQGQFNRMSQARQPDGSILITLTMHKDTHIYKMWVKDLYKPTEVVIREEVSDVGKG